MTGSFNIKLKNKNTGTVISEQTVPAIVTDFIKYESTYGFPSSERFVHGADWDDNVNGMSAFTNSSSIHLFEDELSTDKTKFRFDLNNPFCGCAGYFTDAVTVDSGLDNSKMGDMVSAENSYDYANQHPTKIEFKWNWSADKGNGTIKSLGTGYGAAAQAFDDYPIINEGLYTNIGSVKAQTSEATFTLNASIPKTNLTSQFVANNDSMITKYINSRSSISQHTEIFTAYYQTKTNIIQLWSDNPNVLEGTDYHTTFKYRVINKKWLMKYTIGIAQGMHPLSIGEDYDGEITIYSGIYPLKSGINDSFADYCFQNVENNSYAVFVAQTATANENPQAVADGGDYDVDSVAWKCDRARCVAFVIRGDTPQLYTYDTEYDSPLYALGKPHSDNNGEYFYNHWNSPILFTEDNCYIYISEYATPNEYNLKAILVKRSLSGNTLMWKRTIFARDSYSDFRDGNHSIAFNYVAQNGIMSFQSVYSNSRACIGCEIYDHTDDTFTPNGYACDMVYQTYTIGGATHTIFRLDGFGDNPFFLSPCNRWYTEYAIGLKTNFLYTKANLTTPITKTSDNTLEITLTLYNY